MEMLEIKRGRGARLGPAPQAGGPELGSCPFSTGLARSIALSPRQDLPAFAVLGHATSGGPRLAHSTPSQPGLFRVPDTCYMCALQRQVWGRARVSGCFLFPHLLETKSMSLPLSGNVSLSR